MDREQDNFVPGHRLRFMYTNWKGRRREVNCIVESFGYQHKGYHAGRWVMNGLDQDKHARRSYDLESIEIETLEIIGVGRFKRP